MPPLRRARGGIRGGQGDRSSRRSSTTLLRDYVGRPTPLYFAERLIAELGGARSTSSARTSTTPARTRSTTRSARGCSPSGWARAHHRRDRRRPARRGDGDRLRAARPGVRRLHGRGRTWRARRSTSSACGCWAPRCVPVDERQPDAEGRDQRGDARLGDERRRHLLHDRLGRSARIPTRRSCATSSRVIGREARAQIAGRRPAGCPTPWWPASAAAPTPSASSTRFVADDRGAADRRRSGRARRTRPASTPPRFAGGRLGVLHGARTYVLQDERRPDPSRRIRSPPASTIPASGPSTPSSSDRSGAEYTAVDRRRGAGGASSCCAQPKGSSRRWRARTRVA